MQGQNEMFPKVLSLRSATHTKGWVKAHDTKCVNESTITSDQDIQTSDNIVDHTVSLCDIRCANSDDKFINTLFTKKKISTLADIKVQQLLE